MAQNENVAICVTVNVIVTATKKKSDQSLVNFFRLLLLSLRLHEIFWCQFDNHLIYGYIKASAPPKRDSVLLYVVHGTCIREREREREKASS